MEDVERGKKKKKKKREVPSGADDGRSHGVDLGFTDETGGTTEAEMEKEGTRAELNTQRARVTQKVQRAKVEPQVGATEAKS